MKIRNATGKALAAIHFEPRNRNPPAATKLTNARAIRASPSLTLSRAPQPSPITTAAIPIALIATVPRTEVRYSALGRFRWR